MKIRGGTGYVTNHGYKYVRKSGFSLAESAVNPFNETKIEFIIMRKVFGRRKDIMRLVIMPLTYKGTAAKKEAVTQAINIADSIEKESIKRMALAGIYAFADKVINEDDAKRIIRRLKMNKIERLLEEEKQEAVKKAVEENTKQVTQQVSQNIYSQMVTEMLRDHKPIDEIIRYSRLTEAEIREIEKKMMVEA